MESRSHITECLMRWLMLLQVSVMAHYEYLEVAVDGLVHNVVIIPSALLFKGVQSANS